MIVRGDSLIQPHPCLGEVRSMDDVLQEDQKADDEPISDDDDLHYSEDNSVSLTDPQIKELFTDPNNYADLPNSWASE